MNTEQTLKSVRVVLVRTSHPGNIGATARAMKTMGLSRLWLVNPEHFPSEVAQARASGAVDVLASATVVRTLEEALEGVHFAAALTARRRDLALPFVHPREGAERVWTLAQHAETALVFGNEASGLTNAELAHCQLPVTIPTNPAYGSLNLGAAVQIMCYELRLAALTNENLAPQSQPNKIVPGQMLASHDEVEGFFSHLEEALRQSGFYNPLHSRRLFPRLRRLFGRVGLERDEVSILRGMLTSFQGPRRDPP